MLSTIENVVGNSLEYVNGDTTEESIAAARQFRELCSRYREFEENDVDKYIKYLSDFKQTKKYNDIHSDYRIAIDDLLEKINKSFGKLRSKKRKTRRKTRRKYSRIYKV